ncbi:hypothetical protein LCGC14_0900550 [marine sediment metagenome]|uniref:Uncharacterized protein n=1 Tax=marine sediment metagenome TaxID=412755 RepID=A0A0F9S3H7_9ZZZZ
MKVSVEKLIILICIIFFGYGLVSMVISITIDFSYMFFIFGVINWGIGIVLLIGLYYRLMQYLNKLKKGEYIED